MKDYSLDKQQAKDYVLDLKLVGNSKDGETYQVRYADGRVFGSVKADEKNLAHYAEIQEEQAKTAIQNKDKFVRFKRNSGVITSLSAIGSAVAGYGLTSGAVALSLIPSTGLAIAASVGVITILGTIPAYAKFVKNKAKVEELEKLEFKEEHEEELKHLHDYANALSGVSSKTRKLIEDEEENPFSILNVDRYTLRDLEIILDNMERESRSGFDYVIKR